MSDTLDHWCAAWALDPVDDPIETHVSWLVEVVEQDRGRRAFLKCHKPHSDERAGHAFLTWCAGQGAVHVYRATDEAVLMEYAPGPPLSGVVRQGQDEDAARILVDVVNELHVPRPGSPKGMQPLSERLAPLLLLTGGDDGDIAALTADLLATTMRDIPLHGDIHHDNILQSVRGWLAIDAKGLIGDPHYDLANALFNPIDMQSLVRAEGRLGRMASILASGTGYDRERILSYALCHARVSAIWSEQDGEDPSGALSMLEPIRQALGS